MITNGWRAMCFINQIRGKRGEGWGERTGPTENIVSIVEQEILQPRTPGSRISVVFTPTGPLVYERKQSEKLEVR
jgi:hypothetical protein